MEPVLDQVCVDPYGLVRTHDPWVVRTQSPTVVAGLFAFRLHDSKAGGFLEGFIWCVGDAGVPPIESVPDVSPKNTRDYQPIVTAATRAFLQRVYRPHNERLQLMLDSNASSSYRRTGRICGSDRMHFVCTTRYENRGQQVLVKTLQCYIVQNTYNVTVKCGTLSSSSSLLVAGSIVG